MGPLTRSGTTIGMLGIVSYVAGWQLGWNELMVCATGCGLALLIALGFVTGRHRLEVTRQLSNDHVTVGERAAATLTITNPSRTPVGALQLDERNGTRTTHIDITGLAGGATKTIDHVLDTTRRGVIDVGPAVIAKCDPLGLMRREVDQAAIDKLWVQPRVVSVHPVPVGFAKDFEGPTSDTSPAGDVSFHTLREYSIGDDHRHVHWLSTARTGSLMVRHYVDNRQPRLTVLLDTEDLYETTAISADTPTAADTLTAAEIGSSTFELAVEIAASLVVNTQLAQQPVTLRCGTTAATAPLDDLTVVQPDSAPLLDSVRTAVANERDASVLVIVTSKQAPEALLPIVEEAKRSAHVIVVRCCAESDGQRLPNTTSFSVADLESFQVAWNSAI